MVRDGRERRGRVGDEFGCSVEIPVVEIGGSACACDYHDDLCIFGRLVYYVNYQKVCESDLK